jgi:phenylpropionate dioxygenase-like ring-hydroxylating dioxygenase large terminal subunit
VDGKPEKDLGSTGLQNREFAPRFSGYHKRREPNPNLYLTQVRAGTPGGEYLRRFWMPVAYLSELGNLPLRVRALGEDLVIFKDRSGQIGALHLNCCHRNTSLEFGIVEKRGIRCCYHGRLYDIDGSVLEMPGEPEEFRSKSTARQGAYPTYEFGGIVFVYMGPPERIPVFPLYDRLTLPGLRLVPGSRWPVPCNWLQAQENTLDPAHTATLHAIPQLRSMDHFAAEFGSFPELITWSDTPGGYIYMAARVVADKVWVRSAETLGANMRCISSIFETGAKTKRATPPFMSFWILPIDDHEICHFYVSHVGDGEPIPFEKRRALEDFGQTADRPYGDRQYIPGDYDAQVGQGRINDHGSENLATMDRGIVMLRRYLRRNIEAVEQGKDPHGFYLLQEEVPPTFANDCVVEGKSIDGDLSDPRVLDQYCKRLVQDYIASPPMQSLLLKPAYPQG